MLTVVPNDVGENGLEVVVVGDGVEHVLQAALGVVEVVAVQQAERPGGHQQAPQPQRHQLQHVGRVRALPHNLHNENQTHDLINICYIY